MNSNRNSETQAEDGQDTVKATPMAIKKRFNIGRRPEREQVMIEE